LKSDKREGTTKSLTLMVILTLRHNLKNKLLEETCLTTDFFPADAIMKGALAQVMFDTAMEKLDSCRFLCTSLRIALNFEFPSELQKLIKR
jgi:hypothetical protein